MCWIKIIKLIEKPEQSQANPSKTDDKPKIQKFKLNFRCKVLTKREKAIIIPVQFDWNASNERMMRSVTIEIG